VGPPKFSSEKINMLWYLYRDTLCRNSIAVFATPYGILRDWGLR